MVASIGGGDVSGGGVEMSSVWQYLRKGKRAFARVEGEDSDDDVEQRADGTLFHRGQPGSEELQRSEKGFSSYLVTISRCALAVGGVAELIRIACAAAGVSLKQIICRQENAKLRHIHVHAAVTAGNSDNRFRFAKIDAAIRKGHGLVCNWKPMAWETGVHYVVLPSHKKNGHEFGELLHWLAKGVTRQTPEEIADASADSFHKASMVALRRRPPEKISRGGGGPTAELPMLRRRPPDKVARGGVGPTADPPMLRRRILEFVIKNNLSFFFFLKKTLKSDGAA